MVSTLNKNERWTHEEIMLNCNVAGTYPKGRPKKRWLGNISNGMKSLKKNAELVFDRHVWRKATQKKIYSPNVSNTR